jgi:hypothetical protein
MKEKKNFSFVNLDKKIMKYGENFDDNRRRRIKKRIR